MRPDTPPDTAQPPNLEIEQFVCAFSALKVTVTSAEVEAWFQGIGPGYEHLDDNGIVRLVTTDDQDEQKDEDEDSEELPEIPRVTNSEAMECLNKVLSWIRAVPNASPQTISNLINLRELAAERRRSSRKQSSILSFFRNH